MRVGFCVLLLLAGCRNEHSPTASKTAALGDQIANLSTADATALSEYLETVHGIVPNGAKPQRRIGNATKKDFSEQIRKLGDTIVGLSLTEAADLSRYIAEKHGIQPVGKLAE